MTNKKFGGLRRQSGFTLIEVIVVIVIISVLASLALPRFFSTIEYARSVEGLLALVTIRQSIERCYLMRSDYSNCNVFGFLDIEDPGTVPNTHFTYSIVSATQSYTITAFRNSRDGGSGGSIAVTFDGSTITRNGTGPFGPIQ